MRVDLFMKATMSGTLSSKTIGSGIIRRVDRVLVSCPRIYLAGGIVLIQAFLFFAYSVAGPWIPLGIFYLLNLFFAVKYVGGRFSFLLAFIAATGKTLIKVGFYPQDAHWWHGQWQFVSSLSIYTLFCYLINAQLSGRRNAEEALDKLSKLNEAPVRPDPFAVTVCPGFAIAGEADAKVARLAKRTRSI